MSKCGASLAGDSASTLTKPWGDVIDEEWLAMTSAVRSAPDCWAKYFPGGPPGSSADLSRTEIVTTLGFQLNRPRVVPVSDTIPGLEDR